MNLDRFVAGRQPAWAELESLVRSARGRPERLGPAGVRRLGALYRSAAADLALARRRFPMDPVVARLEDLVGRARLAVYGAEARRESLRGFLGRRYWQRLAERPVLLVVAAGLLFAPMVVAAVWAAGDPHEAASVVPGALGGLAERGDAGPGVELTPAESAAISAQIFVNNIRVTLLAFAGGMSAGLLTAAALMFNGVVIGIVAGLAVDGGHTGDLVQLVAPHGVLELSCIVVAGAAGLRMGWALVEPGRRPRRRALADEARAAVELALGTAPWLVLAGLVEGFVTPSAIGVGPALVTGLGLGAVFWTAAWRRRAPAVTASPAA